MINPKFTNTKFRKHNNKYNLQNLRRVKPQRLISSYNNAVKKYINGVLHPELAVTGSYVPKAPNYVAIPTSNITFREAFDIEPDVNGEFTLFWTPNFLCTRETIQNRMGFIDGTVKENLEYSRNWLGGYDDTYKTYCYTPIASYTPPASFTKYRLVSAGCRITYKGPVINRAGIISHCLSYRAFPVVYFDKTKENIISAQQISENPYLGKSINDIATSSVQNGMWNSVQNVQKNQTTFSVAVPTDPSDFIFEDDAYFYAASTATDVIPGVRSAWFDGDNNMQYARYWPQLPEDGTPCSYIFKGTDLTIGAKLYVEQFYNFEVIPTEESAPILRPRLNDLSSSQLEKSKSLINKILNDTKGQIAQNVHDTINSLFDDEISNIHELPSFTIDIEPHQQQQKQQIYVPTGKPSKTTYKAKQILNKTWNTTKNLGKKVLTQKNIEAVASILGQFIGGAMGTKI